MVKIIGITGGKGGTGKSTIATALANGLSKDKKVLLIDADVDCPNDHLLLGIETFFQKNVTQRIPIFDLEKCTKCGKCGKACVNNAIVSITGNEPLFIEEQCNGCGACQIVCKSDAIKWSSKDIGKIFLGKKGNIDLISGELKANQPISEFIVNSLNEEIEKKKEDYDYIIIDTAAGTHCPVIAALEMTDKIIAVTEPTPLGAHDLDIILQMTSRMNKDTKIIINRSDIGDKTKIYVLSKKYDVKIISEVPFSKDIVDAYSNGKPINLDYLISNILDGLK